MDGLEFDSLHLECTLCYIDLKMGPFAVSKREFLSGFVEGAILLFHQLVSNNPFSAAILRLGHLGSVCIPIVLCVYFVCTSCVYTENVHLRYCKIRTYE
jgi:hypothetical protein